MLPILFFQTQKCRGLKRYLLSAIENDSKTEQPSVSIGDLGTVIMPTVQISGCAVDNFLLSHLLQTDHRLQHRGSQ